MKKDIGTRIFLVLMGAAFTKVGVEALIDPQAVLLPVGITLDGTSAFSSMRAVYGGMHLVFGLFCLYGVWRPTTTPLVLVVLYTTGFVVGRLSGIVIEGMPNSFVMMWLWTEVVSGSVAGWLAYRSDFRTSKIKNA